MKLTRPFLICLCDFRTRGAFKSSSHDKQILIVIYHLMLFSFFLFPSNTHIKVVCILQCWTRNNSMAWRNHFFLPNKQHVIDYFSLSILLFMFSLKKQKTHTHIKSPWLSWRSLYVVWQTQTRYKWWLWVLLMTKNTFHRVVASATIRDAISSLRRLASEYDVISLQEQI